MKTHHLLLVVFFAGVVLRQAVAPGVRFIEWDEWLVIATALATVGYLIHEWRHGRQLDGEIADLFHRVGQLEGARDSYNHIDGRVSDLFERMGAAEAKLQVNEELAELKARLEVMGSTMDNIKWADEDKDEDEEPSDKDE